MSETVTLSLAHSPDSDDLVMWWPLSGIRGPDGVAVEGALGRPAIDAGRYRFETTPCDVEELNRLAVDGEGAGYDITAVSAAVYPRIADRYAITASGGSFGEGYGPKVVVGTDSAIGGVGDLGGKTIAIPGVRTTAYLTLSLMLRDAGAEARFEPMLFSEIPGVVARGEADAGLLIHEAQLTFEREGLRAVADLGAWWEGETGLPLPLGLNVIRRDLDARHGEGTVGEVSRLLGASIRHAVEHADASHEFLRLNAGDRTEWDDRALVEKYLSMYVSDLTLDMGDEGRAGLEALFRHGAAVGLIPAVRRVEIV